MANKKDKKNEVGRPSKAHAFIEVFKESLENEDVAKTVIYLTDEDIVFMANDQLEEKERISQRTFQRWKAAFKGDSVEGVDVLDSVGAEFCRLYKKALILQKINLFTEMKKPTQPHWQKIAWIIERKFDEWNIRQKTELDATVQQKAVTIVKNYKGIEKN